MEALEYDENERQTKGKQRTTISKWIGGKKNYWSMEHYAN